MKRTTALGALIGLLIVLGVAYYLVSPLWRTVELDEALPYDETEEMTLDEAMEEMEDVVIEMDDEMPEAEEETSEPVLLAEGVFMPDKHDVAGEALLIEYEGERTLRFENFDTINGPNLHIYLATDTTASDFVDLGEIRATKGNVNYAIDSSIDTTVYDTVLVWCVPFSVNFSYAELASTLK